ncbi:mCG1037449, partial [Mus musculus]
PLLPRDAVLNPPCSRGSSLVPEDVSCPGFQHHFSSAPQLASKNDATAGSFCTRLFSPVSSFSISPLFISPLFISPLFLYLSCFYISLVYISPLIVILSRIIILPLTRASHSYILSVPIHAQQATPPHQARSFS